MHMLCLALLAANLDNSLRGAADGWSPDVHMYACTDSIQHLSLT